MKNSSQEVSKTVKKKKEEEEGSGGDAAKTHCILWRKKEKELLI